MRATLCAMIGCVGVLAVAGSAQAGFVTGSITSNFNGTAVPSPRYIWFNSHLTDLSGSTAPFTLFVRNQTIEMDVGGTTMVIHVPDAEVRVQPGTTASTTFGAGGWVTTVPSDSGTPFMSGFGWQVPAGGLPGGISPVTWSADFGASEGGLSLDWQWSAAVYTSFSNDMSLLGITPVDGVGGVSQSGSPANFKNFAVGGARGGGASNLTGSNSGTGHVSCIPVVPAPGAAGLMAACGLVGLRRRRSA